MPDWVGLAVCVLVLDGVCTDDTLGAEEALPVLLVEPPVAVALPFWVTPAVNVLNEVPPATAAAVVLAPELFWPPTLATLPFCPPPLAVPPGPDASALPLLPLLVEVAPPDTLVAVGVEELVLPLADPPAPPVPEPSPALASPEPPAPPAPPAPPVAAPLLESFDAAPEVALSEVATGSPLWERAAAMLAATLAATDGAALAEPAGSDGRFKLRGALAIGLLTLAQPTISTATDSSASDVRNLTAILLLRGGG